MLGITDPLTGAAGGPQVPTWNNQGVKEEKDRGARCELQEGSVHTHTIGNDIKVNNVI
jgi:hypothetical protein